MKKFLTGDVLGICGSVLCLIHCLFLPWILTLGSAAWLADSFASPYFHIVMLVVALIIGLPVFIRSYFRHRNLAALLLGFTGLTITAVGSLQEDTCCPPIATAAVETGASGTTAVETEVSGTIAAEEEGSCSSCSSCSSTAAAVEHSSESQGVEKKGGETLVKEVPEKETPKISAVEDEGSGFNPVMFGVCLLIFAHAFNFKLNGKCEQTCCEEGEEE